METTGEKENLRNNAIPEVYYLAEKPGQVAEADWTEIATFPPSGRRRNTRRSVRISGYFCNYGAAPGFRIRVFPACIGRD